MTSLVLNNRAQIFILQHNVYWTDIATCQQTVYCDSPHTLLTFSCLFLWWSLLTFSFYFCGEVYSPFHTVYFCGEVYSPFHTVYFCGEVYSPFHTVYFCGEVILFFLHDLNICENTIYVLVVQLNTSVWFKGLCRWLLKKMTNVQSSRWEEVFTDN